MDYHSVPDIDFSGRLSADAVRLFQRFRQTQDREKIEEKLAAELDAHVRACELAILYAAQGDLEWAVLPVHAIADFDVLVQLRLNKSGFTIRHDTEVRAVERPDPAHPGASITVHEICRTTSASWHSGSLSSTAKKEWKRRAALEEEFLRRHPPRPISKVRAGQIASTNAVWASMLHGKYLVEIQVHFFRRFLAVFHADSRRLLHWEESHVFVDPMGDPEEPAMKRWLNRAAQVVRTLK